MIVEKIRKINSKVDDEGISRLTREYLNKVMVKENQDMDASDSMMPVQRSFVQAEEGVCTAHDHTIVVLGTIPATEDDGSIDEFYCPTCNKFWREI